MTIPALIPFDVILKTLLGWHPIDFPALLLVVILSVISNSGCKSHTSRQMLVARVEGDIYLPHLGGVSWCSEEPVDCELASQQNCGFSSPFNLIPTPAPDDVLLCGNKALTAWEDIRQSVSGD
jgi:hypothetical protein